MAAPLIEVKNVFYDYVIRSGPVHALKGVDASFEKGKMYAVTGRSGSGKTTLLSLIAAFDRPKSGEICYNGAALSSMDASEYRRKNVGIVFQSFNLIPHLSVLENVTLVLEGAKMTRDERKARAESVLSLVGLGKELYSKRPSQLSGGEQQRAAISRAIAADQQVLLADEPTGNLDNENSENVIGILKGLAREGRCVIVVTHSVEVASSADVILKMSDGMIIS